MFANQFIATTTSDLVAASAALKERGMRFMACHAQRADEDGRFDLTYAFVLDETGDTVCLQANVAADEQVPSVGALFPCAFMFENEMHDLYGIDVAGITVDFDGNFYHLHIPEPMAAAPEKAAKSARAKEKE